MINNKNVSIIHDSKGKNVVLINDIRFRGKRSINWDDVEHYLQEYVGDLYQVAETDDMVYIGNDLPDEYAGSKYTRQLRGTAAKAKANAAQGIPELIETATGKSFSENREGKHNRNAKLGWYRYDTRFALPVFDAAGELHRYNIFHATLIIRHSANEKLYLYDILNIKKKCSNPFSNSLTRQKPHFLTRSIQGMALCVK